MYESIHKVHESVFDKTERIVIEPAIVVAKVPDTGPWRFPDAHNPTSSSTSSCLACQCFNDINGPVEIVDATHFDERDAFIILSRGSIIPCVILQRIGIHLPSCMSSTQQFTIQFEPLISAYDDSGLVSLIALKDLKQLLDFGGAYVMGDKSETNEIVAEYDLTMAVAGLPSIGLCSSIKNIFDLASCIIDDLSYHSDYSRSTGSEKCCIMITGEEGCGKTHLAIKSAKQLAFSQMCAIVYLDCKKLQATPRSTLTSILEEIQICFHEATLQQPSVLILDDLDSLVPNVESADGDDDGSIQHQQLNPSLINQVQVIVNHLVLLSQQGQIYRCPSVSTQKGVVLLCTCREKDSLSLRFRESGLMHSIVEVPTLNSHQRTEFLCQSLLGESIGTSQLPQLLTRLGKATDGFRPHDLTIITQRISDAINLRDLNAVDTATDTNSTKAPILESDIASVFEDFTPLSQQSVDITHNECQVNWSSIGGLFDAKEDLHDVIIHPIKFKQIYNNAPIALPTGVLIFGYPGSGKSFTVPSLAKRCNLNLIRCNGPELLDRYIGASEAKVRQLFARAMAAAPAMIFFDEFDALAPQRGSDHTGVTDRVVNMLLTLLDGAERDKKAHQIFVVAATSRPDKIDKALLRPGRLEKHVFFGYPESLAEWNSIFASILTTRHVDQDVTRLQKDGDFYSFFCKDVLHAKEFSAADMKAVLDTAHLLCVHEILDDNVTSAIDKTNSEGCKEHRVVICTRHISEAIKRTRPSLLPKDRMMLQHYYAPFMAGHIKSSSWNPPQSDKSDSEGRRLKTSLR